MSSAPVSRTISDLAKQLRSYDCTDASHSVVVRAVDKAATIAKDRTTRAVLAVRYLEEWGYPVRRYQLNNLVLEFRAREQRQGPEAAARRRAHLLEDFRMPTVYAESDDPFGPRDHPDQPFSMFHWWPCGRSLGVYGADLDRRGMFVGHLIRSMMQSGTRTIVPVRETSQADPQLLAPVAEVVDLTKSSGGIEQLLEGEGEMIVLVDPRHGLEETDLSVLAERVLHPDSRIRVVYTESFALRGWTAFMDAMLDYGESVLLGPAPAADLATFGLPDDFEIPDEPGAGLYLVDGGSTVRFGAPPSSSVYRDAHLANTTWGPCGHRPAVSQGSPPVGLLPGDRLWFWGTKNGRGWVVDAVASDQAVVACSKEDSVDLTLRQQLVSFGHALREEHPWFVGPLIDQGTGLRTLESVCEAVHAGRVRFSDGALRLDLRAVIRDGRMVWSDER